MKKDMDVTRRDFLIDIARMYYERDMSQQEIAEIYGISRSNVSKLLRICKEEKIVEIRIQETSSAALLVQRKLYESFGLPKVIVVPSAKDPEETVAATAKAAAEYICSVMKDGMKIGISWGRTLSQVVNQFPPTDRKQVEVVQLHGGLGAKNLEIDGFELAHRLANKLSGTYRIVQAPLIVKDRNLKKLLLKEPDIAAAIKQAASVDIALVSIGSNLPEISALVRAGYLSETESSELVAKGAVGTICGLHFDENGGMLGLPINERIIGIDADMLKSIPRVVTVASGVQKVRAMFAALKGKLVQVLVTDEETGMMLLAQN